MVNVNRQCCYDAIVSASDTMTLSDRCQCGDIHWGVLPADKIHRCRIA